MADVKITELPELTEVAADDYLEIVDTSTNTNKKISRETLTNFAWQDWTPNLDPNGTGAVLSGYNAARFCVSGRTLHFTFLAENKAMTTRGGICLIGLPVTASASAVSARMYASIYPIGGNYIHARCEIIASSAFMSLHKDFTYSAWVGNETGLYIYVSGFYEI